MVAGNCLRCRCTNGIGEILLAMTTEGIYPESQG